MSLRLLKRTTFGWLMALTILAPVTAHNWVNTPGRALVASVTKPCQNRINYNEPHIQVAPGQEFEFEWSTGHGDTRQLWNYFVAIHESDFDNLNLITDAMVEDYINSAPPESIVDATQGKYMKRHMAPAADNDGTSFLRELLPTDPLFIVRDPVMFARSLRSRDAKLRQWQYKPEHLSEDKRASYVSAKYPWMEAAFKFKLAPFHFPNEYDLSTFSFPARKGPGDYIMYYKWGGYRDCMDINVQPNTVRNRYGVIATTAPPPRYIKLDHCEYTWILNPKTPCTVMVGNSAQVCMGACTKAGTGCHAVQAVRVKNPLETLPYTVNLPLKLYTKPPAGPNDPPNPPPIGPCDSRTVNTRKDCPDLTPNCAIPAGTKDSDYMCYGVNIFRDQDLQAAEDYTFSDDPTNPVFYSTCWVKVYDGGFIPNPVVRPAEKVKWHVGDRCLKCDFVKSVAQLDSSIAPDWFSGLANECVHCDMLRT